MEPDDPRHGTVAGYERGCRLECCRAANTEKQRVKRERLRRRVPPAHVHGTISGYINWGCHCPECRAASTERERNYRARKKREQVLEKWRAVRSER